MFLDTSDVVKENLKHIAASNPAQANIMMVQLAVDALKACAYTASFTTDLQINLCRLAVRLINSAGAAGDSALAGYYQPAIAGLRDILEVALLLDLFQRDNTQFIRWIESSEKERKSQFKPIKVRQMLEERDSSTVEYRRAAYNLYSGHGTHVDPGRHHSISPNDLTIVGPFPDEPRIIAISYDIARHMAAATASCMTIAVRQRVKNEDAVALMNAYYSFWYAVIRWTEHDSPILNLRVSAA
ncbi:hypothetical protein V9K92_06725 [Phyllobacterium sp. CCNWLW109]|uniref:hypothetical protein n=1 Tax=Phyllobacterium sp. CCNWLW109 TaxID=3127479 RepID=UPI003076FDBD